MTLEEIKQAIAKLSPEDCAKLRLWLTKLDADGRRVASPRQRRRSSGGLRGAPWPTSANACVNPSCTSQAPAFIAGFRGARVPYDAQETGSR